MGPFLTSTTRPGPISTVISGFSTNSLPYRLVPYTRPDSREHAPYLRQTINSHMTDRSDWEGGQSRVRRHKSKRSKPGTQHTVVSTGERQHCRPSLTSPHFPTWCSTK